MTNEPTKYCDKCKLPTRFCICEPVMKTSRLTKYKQIVELLASFSKNEKLKVGALILKENRIISTGYNGRLPGKKEEMVDVHGHDISTVHSEMNALQFCAKHGISTKDCDLFITHFPCQICIKLCIMAGIKRIYYIHDYKNEENPFSDSIETIKINGEVNKMDKLYRHDGLEEVKETVNKIIEYLEQGKHKQ